MSDFEDCYETVCKFSKHPEHCNYDFEKGYCTWCSVWLRTPQAWLELLRRLEEKHGSPPIQTSAQTAAAEVQEETQT